MSIAANPLLTIKREKCITSKRFYICIKLSPTTTCGYIVFTPFSSLYNCDITNLITLQLNILHSLFLLVSPSSSLFALIFNKRKLLFVYYAYAVIANAFYQIIITFTVCCCFLSLFHMIMYSRCCLFLLTLTSFKAIFPFSESVGWSESLFCSCCCYCCSVFFGSLWIFAWFGCSLELSCFALTALRCVASHFGYLCHDVERKQKLFLFYVVLLLLFLFLLASITFTLDLGVRCCWWVNNGCDDVDGVFGFCFALAFWRRRRRRNARSGMVTTN